MPFSGDGYGAEFRNKELVYDDYVRDCLLEIGILPHEVDEIFADNERLIHEIATVEKTQQKERADWLVEEREQARERMRRHRARRRGDSTYRGINGQIKSTNP